MQYIYIYMYIYLCLYTRCIHIYIYRHTMIYGGIKKNTSLLDFFTALHFLARRSSFWVLKKVNFTWNHGRWGSFHTQNSVGHFFTPRCSSSSIGIPLGLLGINYKNAMSSWTIASHHFLKAWGHFCCFFLGLHRYHKFEAFLFLHIYGFIIQTFLDSGSSCLMVEIFLKRNFWKSPSLPIIS